jgi:hypothetical protein
MYQSMPATSGHSSSRKQATSEHTEEIRRYSDVNKDSKWAGGHWVPGNSISATSSEKPIIESPNSRQIITQFTEEMRDVFESQLHDTFSKAVPDGKLGHNLREEEKKMRVLNAVLPVLDAWSRMFNIPFSEDDLNHTLFNMAYDFILRSEAAAEKESNRYHTSSASGSTEDIV